MNGRDVGIIFIVFLLTISCAPKRIEQKNQLPKIKFEHTEIDFGEIAQKQKITHIFKFENIGGDTLIIEKVRAP